MPPHSIASSLRRNLIDAIVLSPEDGTLKIELQGNLGAMLKAAQAQNSNNGMLAPLGCWDDERSPDTDDLVQRMLVAGACTHRYRPRSLRWPPSAAKGARA